MTKLKNGILGPISGKLGPVVGASWKGIAYLRTAPQKRNKNAQRSPAQVASQHKFKFLHQWLLPFHSYITIGFRHLAIRKTEINAAFTVNYQSALIGSYPNFNMDYSKVQLSVGQLPVLSNPTIAWIDECNILISWINTPNILAAFDDQLMFVVYSPTIGKTDGFIGGVKRLALSCTFKIDRKLIGHELEVYVSVIALDGRAISNTTYLGRMSAP